MTITMVASTTIRQTLVFGSTQVLCNGFHYYPMHLTLVAHEYANSPIAKVIEGLTLIMAYIICPTTNMEYFTLVSW